MLDEAFLAGKSPIQEGGGAIKMKIRFQISDRPGTPIKLSSSIFKELQLPIRVFNAVVVVGRPVRSARLFLGWP